MCVLKIHGMWRQYLIKFRISKYRLLNCAFNRLGRMTMPSLSKYSKLLIYYTLIHALVARTAISIRTLFISSVWAMCVCVRARTSCGFSLNRTEHRYDGITTARHFGALTIRVIFSFASRYLISTYAIYAHYLNGWISCNTHIMIYPF